MGAGGVCICVSCGVSFYVCMCVGLHVLWLPSVTCVGHVLSLLGWGRRRRSWETAEHKGETQAGRQQAGGLPGQLSPQPRATQVGCVGGSLDLECTCCHDALVFNHVLPPTHARLVPSYPNSYHSPPPGHSQTSLHVVLL